MGDTDQVGVAGTLELCIVTAWQCSASFCLRILEASCGYWQIGGGSFPYNLRVQIYVYSLSESPAGA
jgi:hypothetical protein